MSKKKTKSENLMCSFYESLNFHGCQPPRDFLLNTAPADIFPVQPRPPRPKFFAGDLVVMCRCDWDILDDDFYMFIWQDRYSKDIEKYCELLERGFEIRHLTLQQVRVHFSGINLKEGDDIELSELAKHIQNPINNKQTHARFLYDDYSNEMEVEFFTYREETLDEANERVTPSTYKPTIKVNRKPRYTVTNV